MSQTIYKYEIPIEDEFDLLLPKGAKILSVGVQYEKPMIWALVPRETSLTDMEHRSFKLRGTGHDADGCLESKFVDTFQLMGGGLVFHLFEA